MEEQFMRSSTASIFLITGGIAFIILAALYGNIGDSKNLLYLILGALNIILGIWNFSKPYAKIRGDELTIYESAFKTRTFKSSSLKEAQRIGKSSFYLKGDGWYTRISGRKVSISDRDDFVNAVINFCGNRLKN